MNQLTTYLFEQRIPNCIEQMNTSSNTLAGLTRARHGIEKECIRITREAKPATTSHPISLGSSLLHPFITTDFTEPQLEFTTAPLDTIPAICRSLEDLHTFTIDRIERELLWPLSMPPLLPVREEDITLATYGDSPLGQKKTIYRRGLGHRYGRRIQTISGVHYNFSFKEELLKFFGPRAQQKKRNSKLYCHVARNLLRKIFYFTFLFGASPAFDRSFLTGKQQRFESHKKQTLYSRYATSLRLSEIGYTSTVQRLLPISFNSPVAYVKNLKQAIATINPNYRGFSTSPSEQLSASFLQTENELYLPIRAKQVPAAEETLTQALDRSGIGYLEMRTIDIDPYLPTGVDSNTLGFLQVAFVDALLDKSPLLSSSEEKEILHNHSTVIWQGRRKDLHITRSGVNTLFRDMGRRYGDRLYQIAVVMDCITGSDFFQKSIEKQQPKWLSPELTPSGKMLSDLLDNDKEHVALGVELAERHAHILRMRGIDRARELALEKETQKSIRSQRALDLGYSCG